jgi:hypothetical protein
MAGTPATSRGLRSHTIALAEGLFIKVAGDRIYHSGTLWNSEFWIETRLGGRPLERELVAQVEP